MSFLLNIELTINQEIGLVLIILFIFGTSLIYLIKKHKSNDVSENDISEEQRIEQNFKTKSIKNNYILLAIVILLCIFYAYISIRVQKIIDIDTTQVGVWVSLFGIFASLYIYRVQLSINQKSDTVISKIDNNIEDLQKLNSKIDKNIVDLQSIKPNQDLKETIQEWFNDRGDPDIIFFYFPYTFCPGFWNYADSLNRDLKEVLDKNDNDIKWILIGPEKIKDGITSTIISSIRNDPDIIGDGPFKKKMERILADEHKRKQKNKPAGASVMSKGEEMAKIVQRKYNEAVVDIERLNKDHYRFVAFPLPPNENNLFSFSLVLKIKNRQAQEILILDTFDFFTSDLSKLKNHIGVSSIVNQDGSIANESLKCLFQSPKNSILIKNQRMANFIFSMFLENSYKNAKLKEFLDSNLYEE